MPAKKLKTAEVLKGWAAIAKFLSQPASTVQRWAGEGMPVRRTGRYVEASPQELEQWLGRETGIKAPVHIPTSESDLVADLKRGLSEARSKVRKK